MEVPFADIWMTVGRICSCGYEDLRSESGFIYYNFKIPEKYQSKYAADYKNLELIEEVLIWNIHFRVNDL